MKKLLLFSLFLCFSYLLQAQINVRFIASIEDKYTFPLAQIDSGEMSGILRYSSSLTNFMGKTHFEFSPSFSASINLGILNTGFINRFGDTMTVKQRAYTIPLGFQLTIGDLKDKNVFVGGEMQLPFHYKEKTFIKGDKKETKTKKSEWFGSQVTQFSPAVFLGFQYKKDRYFQIKYHLGDFLNPNNNFNFRGNAVRFTQSSFIEFTFAGILDFSEIGEGGFENEGPNLDLEL